MKVLLANPRGFCAGVDRAFDIVVRAIELFGAPVYVRHEVVHNRFVVDRLRGLGAVFVDELDEVPDGATVIFSAHGVSSAVEQEAARRGLTVFDATCPLVTKVHMEVGRYLKDIVECSKASTEMARAIQRATEEEALAIKQIPNSVENMTEQTENISRAIQEQTKGSRFIIEATDRVKELSQQVKNATGDQKNRSRQIAGGIENVTTQAFHISEAISNQKNNSAEMVKSVEKIRKTTGKLTSSANDMNAVVSALKEDAYNLLSELKKFKV